MSSNPYHRVGDSESSSSVTPGNVSHNDFNDIEIADGDEKSSQNAYEQYEFDNDNPNDNDDGKHSVRRAPLSFSTSSASSSSSSSSSLSSSSHRRSPPRANSNTKYVAVGAFGLIVLLLFAILGGLLGGHGSSSTSSPSPPSAFSSNSPWENLRLSGVVIPTHYALSLTVNMSQWSYFATETIFTNVLYDTDCIILHSKELVIDSLRLMDSHESQIPFTTYFFNLTNDFLVIILPSLLPKQNNFQIQISYHRDVSSALSGFYRSTYVDSMGVTQRIASTQYEATDARTAFICFDEPNFKSTYSLSISTEKYYATVLANMPMSKVVDDVQSNGEVYNKWIFDDLSAPMSTYLYAWVICNFSHQSLQTSADPHRSPSLPPYQSKTISVYSSPDKISLISLALNATKVVVEAYERIFNIDFPLPKIDSIALPSFAAGAMENIGLITYRETALLFDPNENTDSDKEYVVEVISHEVAHQWFGDITTFVWWSGLFLNEGFASFIEYKGTDNFDPTFFAQKQSILQSYQGALSLDSNDATHPILQEVLNPEQIGEIFDAISYDKGSSVLFALQAAVSPPVFFQGLTNYLNKFRFSNANSDDLWDSITEATGNTIDVKQFMDSWITQGHFPLISVGTTNENPNTFSLTQSVFLSNPYSPPLYQSWMVPIIYEFYNGQSNTMERMPITWWTPSTTHLPTLSVSPPSPSPLSVSWIKLNPEVTQFYRVSYPLQWYSLFSSLIVMQLTQTVPQTVEYFKDIERSQLMDDLLALTNSRTIPSLIPLMNFSSSVLPIDPNYLVWAVGNKFIRKFEFYISTNSEFLGGEFTVYNQWKTYVNSLVAPLLTRYFILTDTSPSPFPLNRFPLFSSSSNHLVNKLQNILSLLSSDYNVLNVSDTLSSLSLSSSPIYPNIRDAIYIASVRQLDENKRKNEFYKLLNLTQNALSPLSPAEKVRIYRSISLTNDHSLIDFLLSNVMNPQMFPIQDQPSMLIFISKNYLMDGQNIIWSWFKSNYDAIIAVYEKNYPAAIIRMFNNIFCTFSSPTLQMDYQSFFTTHPIPSPVQRTYQQCVASISSNVHWQNTFYPQLKTFLKDYSA